MRRDAGKQPFAKQSHGRTSRPATGGTRATEGEIRLNKFLAEAGVASRRKADELISEGLVKVNGRRVTELGVRIRVAGDTVTVRNKPVSLQPKLVYILLNKPKDCITTAKDERNRHTVLELVPSTPRVFPVGRLDRNTTGALLLTNDGDLAHRLMHPRFGVLKTYEAELDRGFKRQDLRRLTGGVELDDGEEAAPCEAAILNAPQNTRVLVRLHEGKNRQVRRMFERLGYHVQKLARVEYAGLNTDGLKRGEWRFLQEREVRRLRRQVGEE